MSDQEPGGTGQDEVDEASDESFPASDPPSYTPGHAGSPDHRDEGKDEENR